MIKQRHWPGTSKWNKIEHRLFSRISINWHGRPLTSHEAVVSLIAATTTRTGLTVRAELDPSSYPTGVVIDPAEVDALPLDRHTFHGDWNYTLRPQPSTPAPTTPAERLTDTTQPADRAPDWLHHPTLTMLTPPAFADLLTRVERYQLDHPPTSLTRVPTRRRVLRRGPLSLADRLLTVLLRRRWQTTNATLASLLDTRTDVIGDAILELGPVLDALNHKTPEAPITARTTDELERLVGRNSTRHRSN
jgi:Rhodopirellula transposase DDE domain